MSEEDKLAWNEFANPIWKKMTVIMEKGRNLPEGVYYYVLYSTGSDVVNTPYVRKGSITLLR